MWIRKSIAPVAALLLYASAAQADFIDPATLHIGSGAGTACATGGCPIYFGEVNNISDTALSMYQNQGGASALGDPVLLIFGIPNDYSGGTAANAGTITSATLYNPYPGGATSSLTWSFGTTAFGLDGNGFQGLMTASDGSTDIYALLGLPADTNSNMFGNWAGVDNTIGLPDPVVNFGIYVFALHTTEFAAKDLIDFALSGIPEGTFAVGYGQYFDGRHTTVYDTPFTEAGLNDNPPRIPEPSDGAIFALGLAALLAAAARGKPWRA